MCRTTYVPASRSYSRIKIISYPVGAGGELGAGRDEITTGLSHSGVPSRFQAGGPMWRTPGSRIKSSPIPVGAGGELGAGRDEITAGLSGPARPRVFRRSGVCGGRRLEKIISYPVGTGGELGAGRDEITTGLSGPAALAFSGGRAYVADRGLDKIISYPVGRAEGLGAGRDEITTGLRFSARPRVFRRAGVCGGLQISIKSSPIRYFRPFRSPLRLMRRAFSRKAIARLKSLGTRFWERRITNCIDRKQAADCSRKLEAISP